MDITKRPEADSLALPIPLYASTVIADAVKGERRFHIVAGLDRALVDELKRHALDESDAALQANTSDRKRFGEGKYEGWYAKDRVPFGLVDAETGALGAVAWFGPESFEGAPPVPAPSAWHTIAYRSYGPVRGAGVMKDFARFVTGMYERLRPEAKLWAAIHADNAASRALSKALGYVELPQEPGSEQVIVVKG